MRIHVKGCLATLDQLIETSKEPIDSVHIVYDGARSTYYMEPTDITDLLCKVVILQVESLTLIRLGSDPNLIIVSPTTWRDRLLWKHRPVSKLKHLTILGCDDFQGFINLAVTICETVTRLTIHNCRWRHDEQAVLLDYLESNYSLLTIDVTYKHGSDCDPYNFHDSEEFPATLAQYQRIANRFTSFIEEFNQLVGRNRRMDDNCRTAVASILDMQQFKDCPNYFRFIGGDCTRLIASCVLDSKHDPVWLIGSNN
jgi:hypothetical protein